MATVHKMNFSIEETEGSDLEIEGKIVKVESIQRADGINALYAGNRVIMYRLEGVLEVEGERFPVELTGGYKTPESDAKEQIVKSIGEAVNKYLNNKEGK